MAYGLKACSCHPLTACQTLFEKQFRIHSSFRHLTLVLYQAFFCNTVYKAAGYKK